VLLLSVIYFGNPFKETDSPEIERGALLHHTDCAGLSLGQNYF